MAIKPANPHSLDHIAPCGIRLPAPATESQRKLLTAAGYAQTTEQDLKHLGLGNLPDKANVWWKTRPYPDLIPREALFREGVQKEQGLGDGDGCRDERIREEKDLDL